MSAAGLAARTGRNATRRLAAKIWEWIARSIIAWRLIRGRDIFFEGDGNPGFIGVDDIKNTYLPMGFSNFKIEGRGLGSAMILEFLLYYMTKPQYQIHVREHIYLDNMLDLF